MTTLNEIKKEAVYFDYSKNLTNPAEAHAAAAAKRDAQSANNAYTVFGKWNGGEWFFSIGCYHDALSLARDIHFNNGEVLMIDSNESEINVANSRY